MPVTGLTVKVRVRVSIDVDYLLMAVIVRFYCDVVSCALARRRVRRDRSDLNHRSRTVFSSCFSVQGGLDNGGLAYTDTATEIYGIAVLNKKAYS